MKKKNRKSLTKIKTKLGIISRTKTKLKHKLKVENQNKN